MFDFKIKPDFKLSEQAYKNMEQLTDRVARVGLERTVKKAARPGIVGARAIAKSIPELGDTKGLRLTVKSYRDARLVMGFVGWDAKVPVEWAGRKWKSSNHGERIEFGGVVKRRGKPVRTRPYGVLRKSFRANERKMEMLFVKEHRRLLLAEAAKLNR